MHSPSPNTQPWFCPKCGNSNSMAFSYCTQCGTLNPLTSQQPQSPLQQQYFVQPIYAQPMVMVTPPKSRVAYILLGLFLGGLGIHNFYAGYAGRGVAQLLITIFTFWLIFPILAIGIWVIIEIIVVNKDARGIPFS